MRKKASRKEGLYQAKPYRQTPMDLLTNERILLSSGGPKKTSDNEIKFLLSAEQAYQETMHVIRNAKKSIWITTYILGNDLVGAEILSLLADQAKKGIEVRLLLDGLGSFWVSRIKLRQLKKSGGKSAFFLPLIHIPFFGHSNLRNHRKIILADEKTAIVGGMNLAKEYMGSDFDPLRWVDLSFVLEGSSVQDLALIFCSDWKFASGEDLTKVNIKYQENRPSHQPKGNRGDAGSSSVQIIGSGPDVPGDPLYDSLLSAIFGAQKRIWIATPYFIPDEALAKALELACRRGVDVRLIVPKRSNHLLADFCRREYLRQLALAGGRVYYDLHPMMHAKITLIDDDYAVVGSANMDMRSLLLNYEVGIFLYSKKDIYMLVNWFISLQNQSRKNTVKVIPHFKFLSDFLDGMGRILGPLL